MGIHATCMSGYVYVHQAVTIPTFPNFREGLLIDEVVGKETEASIAGTHLSHRMTEPMPLRIRWVFLK